MNEQAEIIDEQAGAPEVAPELEVSNAEPQESATEDAEEVIVSIGEEPPPPEENAPALPWVRELRKTNRDLVRANRELQSKLQLTSTENQPAAVGQKPKLEDFDYDALKYEEAHSNWYERKRTQDDLFAKFQAEEATQQSAWQAKLAGYGKAKAELRVKDYEDAEAFAQQLFSITQQGVMLQGADNPALVVYALGKNPKRAKELAEITDPVKFAFAVAKLEKELKVHNRRAAPEPERIVQGTGRSSGAVDSTLERLREEASRTGNMTKVIQYKAQKRSATK